MKDGSFLWYIWKRNILSFFVLNHLPRKERFFILVLVLFSLSVMPRTIYASCGYLYPGTSGCSTEQEAYDYIQAYVQRTDGWVVETLN
jgi:hypothetical protein